MTKNDPFTLYGTHQIETAPKHLKAGLLAVDFSQGQLRTITYDGVEVLRGIAYLVRDRDWGTYNPKIRNLEIEENASGFRITYQALCEGPDTSQLIINVHIKADTDGKLFFNANAETESGFETNRCGFCILHPIVGLAGSAVSVEHVSGEIIETQLPDLIEPWQPFKNMRAITHEVMPDVFAECRMEGDTFEMEDQRNWSDASYKTYVRPLALPWPYQIRADAPVQQNITLIIRDIRKTRSTRQTYATEPVRIRLGEKRGTMPEIGIIITPEEAKASLAAIDLLKEIAPQHLLFHYDPQAGHNKSAFTDFSAIANRYKCKISLEIALPCQETPYAEASIIAQDMKAAGFEPNAIIVCPSIDRQSTPPGSEWPPCPPLEDVYAASRAAFPNQRLGGGMLSYFTELNRKRAPGELIDFITHCTNPIVHAADDLSVMQTLEALPFITRSVRHIYGDKPYRIGPSTIPMRQNPYGSRTMDNPQKQRIAMANHDPRHNARFAQAFAMGYAIQVLDAGLDCLTLSAFTGPFGLIAGENEPTKAGGWRPLFKTIKQLANISGITWHECLSERPDKILSFAVESQIFVVNLTQELQEIILPDQSKIYLQPFEVTSKG